jgi:hypothetical protein
MPPLRRLICPLAEYPLANIRTLLDVLPQSSLAQLWRAWLSFEGIPEIDDPEHKPEMVEGDPVDMAMVRLLHYMLKLFKIETQDLLQGMPDSALVYRILSGFHWKLLDYENAIKSAEAALRALSKLETGYAIKLTE